ncbi:Vacuolar protein sorting-associated protein 2-2-like protein [Morus notabilis]|uniref:Vacuolar protein sorting-associated protein 2-2-like protein n=1 Tax=Morus notabilis TaxID=981085 RepID=W9RI36_9ROSA|nr:Vacuolar protein sorting-associated protein 2-2-like protein [Morus notabilis]
MGVATRGIEREIASLQLEEKKLVAEIKKTAKTGNEAATKILARQLVRLRQQITNLQGSRAQIRGVTTHTQALYASTSISTGMKGATKAMVAMNKQMAPTKQVKVIREFQKQSAQLDMTIEMMSDAIDETLDKDEAEEETDELTNQVLDEIGVDIASQLSSAPKGRIASRNAENAPSKNAANTVTSSESPDVEELEKRFNDPTTEKQKITEKVHNNNDKGNNFGLADPRPGDFKLMAEAKAAARNNPQGHGIQNFVPF